MSKDIKIKDLNYHINWLEESIDSEHIKHYKYSDFNQLQLIGGGSFGSVYRATWKNRVFALKSFNNDNQQTLEKVIKEVQCLL